MESIICHAILYIILTFHNLKTYILFHPMISQSLRFSYDLVLQGGKISEPSGGGGGRGGAAGDRDGKPQEENLGSETQDTI